MEEDVVKVMESLPESPLRTETFTPKSPQPERAAWLKVMSQNWGQLHLIPG